MASTTTSTDLGTGVGVLFSLLAVGAALATTVFGYDYALSHAHSSQIASAAGFAVAMVAAGLAVAAVHLYEG